ncbi:MAG: FAD-dependent oxidoreductase [Deltaproteobacteria bacterium]|jgi:nitrite reductase (NADH) large subunit|nr:FAD-dependent oxidoreductase [Deltaproteobacteria bacterium]
MNIVIAGGGVAGVTAAETARKTNPKADITVFSAERDLLYFRPRLPEIVSGKLPLEKIFAHPTGWYQEQRLEMRLGENLVEVCPDTRVVRGSMGSRLVYDRLLVATGADSSTPPPVDYKLPGVFTLRRLHDAQSLYYEASRCRAAVLMGAGLLAMEIGAALGAMGLTVHVLERAGRILPRQTTPASSAKLNKHLTDQGLVFHLDSSLKAAAGHERLSAVELSDGTRIDAQILVVAAGVTPNLTLANAMKLKVDRGIVADEYLETSTPGVYAAGDCAQTADGFGGLWTIGRAEGLVAGHNVACEPAERKKYVAVPPSSTLKVAGLDLVAAGNIDPDDKLTGAVFEDEKAYRKVVVDNDGLVVGYTNLGTTKGNRELAGALGRKRLPPDVLRDLSATLDFDFARVQNIAG